MKLRKITSLFAMLSAGSLLITSIVLCIFSQGLAAYRADWRILGLSKTDRGGIHINSEFFLPAIGLHLHYNRRPIAAFLKNKSPQLMVFTAEFNGALALTVAIVAGSYFGLPPFSWTPELNDSFKTAAAIRYGEPPYGHAELSSLQIFAKKTGLSTSGSLHRLRQAGYLLESEKHTLAGIFRLNRVSPQKIHLAARSGTSADN